MKYRALSRHEWFLNCPFLRAYRSDTLLKRFVTETQLIKCDLSHENLHYHGYPFACLKLPFTCCLASACDWSDAIWMGWVICSEKNFSHLNGCSCLLRKHRHAKRARVIFLVIGVFVELFTVMVQLSFLGGCDVQQEGNWKFIICKYNVTSVMVRKQNSKP